MKSKKIAYLVGALPFLAVVTAAAYESSDEDITTFTEQSQAYYQHKKDEAAFCSSCWFVGAGGALNRMETGNSFLQIHNSSNYGAPPSNQNDLFAVNTPNTNHSFFAYGGYTWAKKQTWLPEISVAMRYEYLSPVKISGGIDQYTLPGYDNYNYQMTASAHVLTLLSKLDLVTFGSFAPYVSLGLGIARDKLYNYQETPIGPVYFRPSPAFGNTTQMNFTFNLGAGLDYFVNDNISLALGYEHEDLGSLESGPGASQYQGQRLSFGSLTANRILLNAFYKLQF